MRFRGQRCSGSESLNCSCYAGGLWLSSWTRPRVEKWQALAELLGLDAINQLRLDLQYARNALEDAAQSRAEELATRESSLGQLVEDVSDAGVLQALAAKCADSRSSRPLQSLAEALASEWIAAIVPQESNDKRTTNSEERTRRCSRQWRSSRSCLTQSNRGINSSPRRIGTCFR